MWLKPRSSTALAWSSSICRRVLNKIGAAPPNPDENYDFKHYGRTLIYCTPASQIKVMHVTSFSPRNFGTLLVGARPTISWCLSTAITQREKVEVKLNISGRKVET